ncbi:interleukin-17 receptor E-like protein [Pholidichthys leucotaenia]
MEACQRPPRPFLESPGEPDVLWPRWLDVFETYVATLDLGKLDKVMKRALFVHNLGIEGTALMPPAHSKEENLTTCQSLMRSACLLRLRKMILFVALLLLHCCLGLTGVAAEKSGLEKCTSCSQGLQCKPKQPFVFPRPCQNHARGLNATSVFHNISPSTVMRCEGRQMCSLYLRVKTLLQLDESVHGISFCTTTAGMMTSCQILSFSRASRNRMSGLQVEVESSCTSVSPSQDIQVTVKTVPSYCGMTWTSTYQTPGCRNDNFRKHVPECITGTLSYNVNPMRKELSVNVSDMLKGHNYHVRLCRKGFICIGTGVHTLIKKEQPIKSAILPYSRPLPCLCIEGWSAVMDAPRVQVCPFEDRLEELWSGITFDPLEETLLWDPACSVTALVALCEKQADGTCVDLPNSARNVSREKVIYTKVDPHDKLCMKFTTGAQSWTRCPFASGRFQAWEVAVVRSDGHEEVKMLSQVTATFSVKLCVKSAGSPVCETTKTSSVHVEKHKAVDLKLEGKLCNCCLQMKRTDVKHAVTIIHCLEPCDESPSLRSLTADHTNWDLMLFVLPAGLCLVGVIIVTLGLHVLLTVYQRRKQKRNAVGALKKETALDLSCVVSVLQTPTVLHGKVLMSDSSQCENEKANLLSD